ncbi:pentatricopeptide repeat-containing protein-like, chloroplastic [Iris pallida]|uniref:Pentatricopeptide repeat-containing protein-like, chloroplastic n=1 Tax=Iris pallida TaxID=29817 RepID=A0AAX6F7M0_IRIPA|nr:pentatricopeptide repeat-containing protein-like, chloroplastic [Iris pallida]KAJ6812169.1 pentatricopeptide repeat-containing protein-like, chloroplastic [Iris pallida]
MAMSLLLLHPPLPLPLSLPKSFLPRPTKTHRHRPITAAAAAAAAAAATSSSSRSKPKELVLGNPSVTLEKGKYSYEVETLINKLSSLPPRGSIARCLDSFRGRLSLPDFALVFKEFSRRGDWQRSLRLFKYMQRQPWCRPSEHIHAILISLLARESLLDKCRQVFDEMPDHSVPRTALSFTALIAAYARSADHASALSLLSQMKADRVPPTVLTYNTVIAACDRGGLPFDALLGLFAEMRHDGLRPDLSTYNTLLSAAASRRLPDQSEMLLRTMLEAGVSPDTSTYGFIVEAFAGRLSRVSELLAEMASAGHIPDAAAYNVLMEAYARSGDPKEAMTVLRQMQAAGCTPNAATYSILLNLYGRNGRYEDVRELFLEMKVGSTEPDASIYNILIRVFGEGGYFKEVVMLFQDMVEENVEPNMETYEGLAYACGKGGLHKEAKLMLSHMNTRGVLPSAKAYTGVVEACGQAALYEEAIVAFNTMHEIGSLPTIDTYNSLLFAFARGGLFKEAEAILMRMNGKGIQRNTGSFNGLIEAYCHGGQFEDAVKAYVEMQKSRCDADEWTLEEVLNVYSVAGLVEESKEQFQEIVSAGVLPSVMAYCMLLSVYARNDRWDEAYQLLEEMKTSRVSNTHQVIGSMILGEYDDESNWQMVEYVLDKYNSEGCGFGLRLYNALLDALWWFGQKARAAQVLREATRRALFPELFRRSKILWSLDVHRMSVGGSLTAISVWLNDIHERFQRGEDLPNLVSVVVVRGEMEKSSVARGLPVVKAAYSFLRDSISPSFHFPGWNKGRIICHRTQLKRLLTSVTAKSSDESLNGFVSVTNSSFPLPGTRIHTADLDGDDLHDTDETADGETEDELMAAAI